MKDGFYCVRLRLGPVRRPVVPDGDPEQRPAVIWTPSSQEAPRPPVTACVGPHVPSVAQVDVALQKECVHRVLPPTETTGGREIRPGSRPSEISSRTRRDCLVSVPSDLVSVRPPTPDSRCIESQPRRTPERGTYRRKGAQEYTSRETRTDTGLGENSCVTIA